MESKYVRFALGPMGIHPWNGVESLVGEFPQKYQGKVVMYPFLYPIGPLLTLFRAGQ